MDIEGINIRDVEEINYELVEKIGNLRHPMISVVIETVSDLNNMLKDPQNTQLFKKLVILTRYHFFVFSYLLRISYLLRSSELN